MLFETLFVYIATFYLLWWFALVPCLLRTTRAELFDLRDRLFVEHRNNLEYGRLREHINALIRYAEKASWQRLTVNMLLFAPKKIQPLPSFKTKAMKSTFLQSLFIIGKLFILRSPFLMVAFSMTAVIALVYRSFFGNLREQFKKAIVSDVRLSVKH